MGPAAPAAGAAAAWVVAFGPPDLWRPFAFLVPGPGAGPMPGSLMALALGREVLPLGVKQALGECEPAYTRFSAFFGRP